METGNAPVKRKSIFISRKITENGPFGALLNNRDIQLIDEPLIRIIKVPFSHTPQTQWIFFSSKNAIRFFFSQNPVLPAAVKFGVISKSSAVFLESYGKTVDFIGKGVHLTSIAKSFRDVLQNDSVLFPQAMDSLQTIQKYLSFTNTTFNLYTYKTVIRSDFELPYTDVLIFTSPSNVNAYYSKYRIDVRQLVIAMGSTTQYQLSGFGIKNVLTPDSFDEEGLFEVMLKVS